MPEQAENKRDPWPGVDPAVPFRLTADDLLSDLLWPKLLRAPALAFRPGRIGVAAAALLLAAFVDKLAAWAAGGAPLLERLAALVSERAGLLDARGPLDIGGMIAGLLVAVWDAAGVLWADAPLRVALVTPVVLLIHGLAAVAIGRMAAEEFARGRFSSWPEGLGWAARSLTAVLLAHLIPACVIALLIGLVSLGGLALLSVPFVNVIGAVFGIVALAVSLVAVVLILGYALGFGMLSPAIACEGSDGIDAMQRVYAVVLGRPLRWLLYSAVLVVQFLVVSSVAVALVSLTVGLAVWSMSLWLGDDASMVASGVAGEGLGSAGRAAARTMAMVLTIPAILATGYLYAYWVCGWTVQYLLLRRALDGQDVIDIHVPGEVEARVDEIMARREAEDRSA